MGLLSGSRHTGRGRRGRTARLLVLLLASLAVLAGAGAGVTLAATTVSTTTAAGTTNPGAASSAARPVASPPSDASAAAATTVSSSAFPRIVNYLDQTSISGHLSSGQKGIFVNLEQRQWPYNGRFTIVASQKTGGGGKFRFYQTPSVGTDYRVQVGLTGAKSGTTRVYVAPGYMEGSCRFTNASRSVGCSQDVPPGSYTLSISFNIAYPAQVYGPESSKHVWVYYGDHYGYPANPQPPSYVYFQKTVAQSSAGVGKTSVTIHLPVTVPSYWSWFWALAICTRTSYQSDGFGLWGAPGSHGCGGSRITYGDSLGNLG